MDIEGRWAREEFGGAELGDERRRSRLVAMGAQAARVPAGKISEVFATSAARQGAYDFLENPNVDADRIMDALAGACVERCREQPYVFIAVDGTSLNLTERTRSKGFRAYRSRLTARPRFEGDRRHRRQPSGGAHGSVRARVVGTSEQVPQSPLFG